MDYFGLNCDWEGYWAESFAWKINLKRAREAFDKGLNAQQNSAEQADAWRNAVAVAENTRALARSYRTSFSELHHLPTLFIDKTEALIAFYTYHANTVSNSSIRIQEEYNRLWGDVEKTGAAYNAEFQRVSSLIGKLF